MCIVYLTAVPLRLLVVVESRQFLTPTHASRMYGSSVPALVNKVYVYELDCITTMAATYNPTMATSQCHRRSAITPIHRV